MEELFIGLIQIIVEPLFQFVIITPGAFCRWIWNGSNKTFLQYLDADEGFYSSLVSYSVIIVCGIAYIATFKI